MKNVKSLVAGVLVCVVAFGTSRCARPEMQEYYQNGLDELMIDYGSEDMNTGSFRFPFSLPLPYRKKVQFHLLYAMINE